MLDINLNSLLYVFCFCPWKWHCITIDYIIMTTLLPWQHCYHVEKCVYLHVSPKSKYICPFLFVELQRKMNPLLSSLSGLVRIQEIPLITLFFKEKVICISLLLSRIRFLSLFLEGESYHFFVFFGLFSTVVFFLNLTTLILWHFCILMRTFLKNGLSALGGFWPPKFFTTLILEDIFKYVKVITNPTKLFDEETNTEIRSIL